MSDFEMQTVNIQEEEEKFDNSMKGKYGFLPTSVWYCTKNSAAHKFIMDDDAELKDKGDSKGGTTKMSEFDPEVADRIIKYWSNKGDQILDPFCGRATRAICSILQGRDYRGYEISPKHHAFTVQRISWATQQQMLFDQWGNADIVLGDGVKMECTPDDFADMIMTCPPYWNIEKYESVDGQLSDIDDYPEFQAQMAEHAKHALRKVKSGGHAIYVVNDFRRNGKFYDWHNDMIRDFKAAGWELHDLAVNKVNSVAIMGVGAYEKDRKLVKLHEYVLIFKKP